MLKSGLYEGSLRHRRFTPVKNDFTYSMFMMYLDLDEMPDLFRGRWLWSAERPALAWFRRADHWGPPKQPLGDSIRDLVEQQGGTRPTGPIRLLTHLRYFGYCQNPASFYYCFDREGRKVETIVAEVTNTPWGETHPYVLDLRKRVDGERPLSFRFPKAFHVSPFMEMAVEYHWRFDEPAEMLSIHMENLKNGDAFFDSTLTLRRKEINGANLAGALCRYPFLTAKVVAAIYFQAARLWLKKVPFQSHPKHRVLKPEEK